MKNSILLYFTMLSTLVMDAQNYQWAKRISGDNTSDFDVQVLDMVATRDGNSYVSGKFLGKVDFDPSAEVYYKTAVDYDGFVARYDSSGSLDWVYTTNNSGDDEVTAISFFDFNSTVKDMSIVIKFGSNAFQIKRIDSEKGETSNASSIFSSSGTIDIKDFNDEGYLVGGYTGAMILDSSSLTSNGLSDGFCIRFLATSSTYTVSAAKTYGGAGFDIINCIYDDYMGGSYTGTYDMDFFIKTSAGGKDGFFFKFDKITLQFKSAVTTKSIGGLGDDEVLSVIDSYINENGHNVAIGGYFTGTVNFNISGATTNLVSSGGKDGFIASYQFVNSSNNYISTGNNKLGTIYDDEITNMSITNVDSNIYFFGKYGNISGGSEAVLGSRIRTSPGTITASYFGKFSPTNATSFINPKAIYFLDTNIFYAGDFTGETDFNISSTTSTLSVNNGGRNAFIQRSSFCNTSGTAPTITGDLFICSGESATLKLSGAINGNLEWIWFEGACNSAIIGTGTSITVSPKKATVYRARADGGCAASGSCNSGATVQATSVSNAVSVSGNTIKAIESGMRYQWIDCNNENAIIVGATNQSFTSSVIGNYAVQITNISGCQATSDCTQNTLGIPELIKNKFEIYPNPTRNYFEVQSQKIILGVNVFNSLGQKVMSFDNQKQYNIESLPRGIYLVIINSDFGEFLTRIIKH